MQANFCVEDEPNSGASGKEKFLSGKDTELYIASFIASQPNLVFKELSALNLQSINKSLWIYITTFSSQTLGQSQ